MVLTSLLSFIKNSRPVRWFFSSLQPGKGDLALGSSGMCLGLYMGLKVCTWQQVILAKSNLVQKAMGEGEHGL